MFLYALVSDLLILLFILLFLRCISPLLLSMRKQASSVSRASGWNFMQIVFNWSLTVCCMFSLNCVYCWVPFVCDARISVAEQIR